MNDSEPERYQIIHRQGAGWTGVSYLARDRESGRQVVLKPLPGACGQAGNQDVLPSGFVGFDHPNVVAVYDVLEESGVRYAVLGHVSGKSLAKLAGGQGQQASWVRTIAVGCLEALAAGAARGLTHGDIKPDNILIVEPPDGQALAKLQDFGFAGMADEKAMRIIVGDVHCLAPERFAGQPADERTDLYALGTCLYFALTGRMAFPDVDQGKAEASHRKPPAQPLALMRPDIPAAFTAWVERLMAPDRDKRMASIRVALATLPPAEVAASNAAGESQPAARPKVSQNVSAKPARRKRRLLWMSGMLACGISMGIGGTLLWQKLQTEHVHDMANRRFQEGPKKPLPKQPPIVLRGGAASILGKSPAKSLRPGPKPDEELGAWFNLDEYPEWPITIVRPGLFRITLDYSLALPPDKPGSRFDVLVDRRKLPATVKGGGTLENHMTVDLGELKINQTGPMVLKIRPVSKSGYTLMNLRALTLTWREPD
jgi:hypothetical protein